ncbi:MAG: hypothetical protein IPO92_06740 [Saprospiraceae bacterium]|nr:hypothetical protein [Saprospiraceae bacterium]
MYHFTKSFFCVVIILLNYSFSALAQTNIVVNVFEDLNGNGIQNGGEPTAPITPELWLDSEPNGSYETQIFIPAFIGGQFTGVPNGNYEVRYPSPSGSYIRTTIANNQVITSGPNIFLEVGYYLPATIGDYVWEDVNGNGIQNGGEPGILGVSVDLNGTDGLGNAVNLNDVTNASGIYTFTNVPPGNYTISFNLPSANHFFSKPDNTIDTNDSDANQVTGDAPAFSVISDQVITNIDAGMYIGATISNFVWEDLNGNGIQDGGEPGFPGVNVNLNGTDGAGTPVSLGPIASNGAGNYIFSNLPPGTYVISFGPLPANHFFSLANQTIPANDSNPNPLTGVCPSVTVISNQDVDDVDAGLFEAVSIGNYVWEDVNGNGIQDGGEPALAGINISIKTSLGGPVTKADGTPANPVVSSGAGAYIFDVLRPGSYIINFATNLVGPNYYRTSKNAGGPTVDSDANVLTGDSDIITTVSADQKTDVDAGYFRAGTIGDKTWIDFNGNGTQDDPSPLGGVSVAITDNLGGAVTNVLGAGVGPVVSDGAGAYSFPNLKPGMYKLTFTAPAGYFPTKLNKTGGATDITDTDDDSDVDQGMQT